MSLHRSQTPNAQKDPGKKEVGHNLEILQQLTALRQKGAAE